MKDFQKVQIFEPNYGRYKLWYTLQSHSNLSHLERAMTFTIPSHGPTYRYLREKGFRDSIRDKDSKA